MLIVNSVGMGNGSCESAGSITPPKFPSDSMDIWIANEYYYIRYDAYASSPLDNTK